MSDVSLDLLESAAPPVPQAARSRWRPSPGTIASLAISAGLLTVLYLSVDGRLVLGALRAVDPSWLVVSMGIIIPITVLRAVRFYWVTPPGALPGVAEALRLTLVATALNTFMPAKTGDLTKSYFVATRGGTSTGVGVAIVVYERLCDLAAMILWCITGWLASRPLKTSLPAAVWPMLAGLGVVCMVLVSSVRAAHLWRAVMRRVLTHRKLQRIREVADGWPDLLETLKGRRKQVIFFSLFLWLVHLTQIWMFTVALGVPIPFAVCASLSAVVLMAGQVPFTFAGLGARDVALVVLLAGYMRPETAAALAILISTRGLLPPLAALPIMRPYLAAVLARARQGVRGTEPPV